MGGGGGGMGVLKTHGGRSCTKHKCGKTTCLRSESKYDGGDGGQMLVRGGGASEEHLLLSP